MNNQVNKYIILGAGGHAKVLASAIKLMGGNVLGYLSPDKNVGHKVFLNGTVLGGDDYINKFSSAEISLVNGIGHLPRQNLRKDIFVKFKDQEYLFATVIHPNAYVAQECSICEGAQLMVGAVVQPGSCIGKNVILNTGAKIDHDVTIGHSTHIAPGATICGGVTIGDNCFIGSGATIIQGISIGDNVIVAAGAVVRENIEANAVFKI